MVKNILLMAAAFCIVIVAFNSYGVVQRYIGRVTAIKEINKKTEAINEKARKARNDISSDGAAERVRSRYCRDC